MKEVAGVATEVSEHWLRHWIAPAYVAKREAAHALSIAASYAEWREAAAVLDKLEGGDAWKMSPEDDAYDYVLLREHLAELVAVRKAENWVRAAFLLRTTLCRDLGGIASPSLYVKVHLGTKDLIESYVDEVVCQLNYLATNEVEGLTAAQKLEIFVQLRGAYGQSALLLSGGAGLGIHHFGVIKALHEAELLPRIISGSSAGALIGALVCVTPASELKAMLSSCTSGFNAFAREGEAETTSAQKLAQFLQSGSIADVQVLKECARSNLGDLTFQEQYDHTGRILNITVNSRRKHGIPRLLNYLTSPNVVIWSAACASCAFTGLFEEVEVMCKDAEAKLVPWNPPGTKWSDGSLESDLPTQRLRELFNVNHFIVSQVNPHVVPILRAQRHPKIPWLLSLASSELDFRLRQLSSLGIIPVSLRSLRGAFAQNYTGDITIVPDVDTEAYIQLLSNPTQERLQRALALGQQAAWPRIGAIQTRCKIELALERIVQQLRGLERWTLVP